MTNQATYIYCLIDPIDLSVRYVGKSINPASRLRSHIRAARSEQYQHHTSRWIRKLLSQGVEPTMHVLETVGPERDWRELERMWIRAFETARQPLTNSTVGGEGLDYRNPEDKARFLENLRASMEAYRATPEGKEQLARMQAAANSTEVIARRSEAIRRAYAKSDLREKMAQINVEIAARPEVKDKKSAASKAMWKRDEVRAKFAEAFSDPECKRKQSEAKKKTWQDEEKAAQYRAGLKAAWADPEKRAARLAKRAATEAAKGKKVLDPEMLAKRNAAIKASWDRRKAEKLAAQQQTCDNASNVKEH